MGKYRMRDEYKDAFESFIDSVNGYEGQDGARRGGMDHVHIYMSGKLGQKGVSRLSEGQQGSYLIIELQGSAPEALAIYAPAFKDGQQPERTLRFKADKRGLDGIGLVRFKNGDEDAGHPYPELDADLHVAASRLINQSSFQPLFEPADKGGGEGGMPPAEHFEALAREGGRSKADACFRAILADDGGRGCAKLLGMLDGPKKEPSVAAAQPMLKLAAWTRCLDASKAAGGNEDIESAMHGIEARTEGKGSWHALGLDSLHAALRDISDRIGEAKARRESPDVGAIVGGALGADAVAGLCSLAVYRRCSAYMDASRKLASSEKTIPQEIYDMLGSAAAMNEREHEAAELRKTYAEAAGAAELCYPKYMLTSQSNARRYGDEDLYRQWRAERLGTGATAYDPELLESDVRKRTYIKASRNESTGRTSYSFTDAVERPDGQSASGGSLNLLVTDKSFRARYPALALAKDNGALMPCIAKAMSGRDTIDILKAEFEAFKSYVPADEKERLREAMLDDFAGRGGAERKGHLLIEEAERDLIGIPDAAEGSLSFGWLAKKACRIDGKEIGESSADNPLRLKALRMNSFDPREPAYEACSGYIRALCEEYAGAESRGDGPAKIKAGAKLNDFMVMMDTYRPDTEEAIEGLKSDIEAMHAGKPAEGFLYRPSCASDVSVLKALAKDGADLGAFRGLSGKDRDGFAKAVADTVANDIESRIDTDALAGKIRQDAVSADTTLHGSASDLIRPVREAAAARETNIEAHIEKARAYRELKEKASSLEDSQRERREISFTD